MTVAVAVMPRTNALRSKPREDLVGDRLHWVTTDHDGRSQLGPVRHRKQKGQMAMTKDPSDTKSQLRIPPLKWEPMGVLPGPELPKPSRWQRLKDRVQEVAWHHQIQHAAVDVLLWSTALTAAGLGLRVLIWAYS